MDKNELERLVELELSTHQISKELNCSQTNVRHWLRKFGMNTKHNPKRNPNGVMNQPTGLYCRHCSKELLGYNTRYCDNKCKTALYYAENKDVLNANTNERQRKLSKERKLKLIEMSGGSCNSCGYCKNYSALQFHHKDPKNKVFTLDSRLLSNTNWESILDEWKKCELLCSNCHFELHNPNNIMV